jgi:glycosyltransferase involved in cell wall biosynthesis
MAANPRITWLLPVKNGMPFLPDTLASIEAQTYRNWEILAWDNNSSDGTLAELHRWIPDRLPGQVISGRPLPLGACLAQLTGMAQTELCARIDGDDINDPTRLELQAEFLESHPEVGVLGTRVDFVDDFGRVFPCPDPHRVADAEIRWLMRWINPICHPTVVFRKSLVMRAGNYRDCGSEPLEDYDLWFRMALITEMRNLPQVLLKYRKHASSATAKADANYFRYFDMVAERYAGFLFAGREAENALALRKTGIRDGGAEVRRSDAKEYRKAAMDTAAALDKPSNYFVSTQAYRDISKEMTRNYLLQWRAVRMLTGVKRFLTGRSRRRRRSGHANARNA